MLPPWPRDDLVYVGSSKPWPPCLVHSRGKGRLPETPERGRGWSRQADEAGAGQQGGARVMEEVPQAPRGPHEQLLGLAKAPLPLV